MGLLNFGKSGIAIDLGTANTLIMQNDKIILNEPSIIATNSITGEIVAFGQRALQMHEKTHEYIKTIRPLRDGVISNYQACEAMIRSMIKSIFTGRNMFLKGVERMIISIPFSATEVEKRAVRDSAEQAGAKDFFMIHEPIAAAMGLGLNVSNAEGSMVIDIGGGTTEIAIISMGGVVCNQSLKMAGDSLNNEIVHFMRKEHNLMIGERTAEKIKIEVGAAIPDLKNPPAAIDVVGRDLLTGLPKSIKIHYGEIADALDKSISMIEEAVVKTLETCPPELAGDIYDKGIYLTGGGAGLRGMDKRIEKRTHLKVHATENNLTSVITGAGLTLKSLSTLKHVMIR
jgi:rod shape-determining protein MreB and related proteins